MKCIVTSALIAALCIAPVVSGCGNKQSVAAEKARVDAINALVRPFCSKNPEPAPGATNPLYRCAAIMGYGYEDNPFVITGYHPHTGTIDGVAFDGTPRTNFVAVRYGVHEIYSLDDPKAAPLIRRLRH